MIRLRELPPSFRDNDAPALTPPPRPYECTGNVSRAMCGECGERTSTSLCDAKTPRGTCDIAATLLAYADDRARLLALATRASMLNGPVILAPVDAFAAPAHNPGARVVPTGGGR